MTSLLGLSITFAVLTLIVVAGLAVLLRQRRAGGRRAVPDRGGEEPAMPSAPREEHRNG
jgi:hypothetical protein